MKVELTIVQLQCTLTLSSRLEAQASEQTPIVVAVS